MADPEGMILPLLREMRADAQNGLAEMRRRFEAIDARFDRLEKRFDNLREAVNGESVLGRYAAAEVEERLEAIEKRLASLESRS
ncbi:MULTISPECIES: hypothetical protein [Methylobacterium]|uniref:Uncharacterized protein n=1 Tax=Methylobacterium jeotgali TaxID=381630 RepID=A0ABQ4SWB1_9HYPH|nr:MULTISPECIES: hypothetical protein [Methylobacterium]PIU05115.1 MAG: hypothetical protein COT56_16760 [Methylobacterium sp. CG09_land_8_20_14_0_10_71_15]PIU12829.1 MAG: hypothetical protein COT28_13420 [Methylobacterium sp. CG08_land_8_20_14_0_20_71_15]GJE06173.1 hypothetical protein AOPFMNJM_1486 [Methylobacterium jeotgali]